MKQETVQHKIARAIYFIFFLFFLSACGEQQGAQEDTGSIAFSLGIAPQGQLQKVLSSHTSGHNPIDCVATGIDKVRVTIKNTANTTVASQDFACSLHAGIVDNVPVGTMTVQIHGLNASTQVAYSATVDSVSVASAVQVNLGNITLVAVATSTPPVTGTSTPPVTGTSTLTISKPELGTGTVTSSPSGINCGATCSAQFSSGSTIKLTATAEPDAIFSGWSGSVAVLCGMANPCTVILNGATNSISAIFKPGMGRWNTSTWNDHQWGP